MTFMLPLMLGVVLLCWAKYLSSPRRRAAFCSQDPFAPATWGLAEILGIFLLYVGVTWLLFPAAESLLDWRFPPAPSIHAPTLASAATPSSVPSSALTTASLVIVNSIATVANLVIEERKLWIAGTGTLLAVLLGSSLLAALTKGRVGWSLSFLSRDLRLAGYGIALCLPVVFLVQAIVVHLPGMEYEHPLMRLLLDNPSGRLWLALGLTAIIAAPIAEEFFFRGLLQGWLEATLVRYHDRTSPPSEEQAAGTGDVSSGLPLPLACLPILLSSVLFSAAHFNHGGGWIAIFILAIGLGILYHKTHRLFPCILLHMALNSTSFALAYFGSRMG